MKTLEEILDKVDITSPIIITKDFDWTTLEHEFVKSKKAACGMLQGKKIKYYEKTYKSRVMVYEMKYNEGEVFENDDLYKITNTHHDNRQTYNEIIVLMNEPNYNRCKEIRKVVESRIENLNLFTTELGMFNLIIIKK